MRTMHSFSKYAANKKKDKEDEALNELISSFFSKDVENEVDATKHEQIYTSKFFLVFGNNKLLWTF